MIVKFSFIEYIIIKYYKNLYLNINLICYLHNLYYFYRVNYVIKLFLPVGCGLFYKQDES